MPQYSVAVNNARLDSIETTIGASARLHLYTGAIPANCAAAATGTKVLDIVLPADYMGNASNASKVKQGTWSGTAIAAGTVGYYRIVDSTGAVVGMQGVAGMSGTEMILDNTNVAVGQTVTVNTFTINAANT